MVSTSYDSFATVTKKYPRANEHITSVQKWVQLLLALTYRLCLRWLVVAWLVAACGVRTGAVVRHGIDATQLHNPDMQRKLCPSPSSAEAAADSLLFDRIVFNFPHTGQQRVHLNRVLIRDFMRSAPALLTTKGQIHLTLKDRPPYSHWNVGEQATEGLCAAAHCNKPLCLRSCVCVVVYVTAGSGLVLVHTRPFAVEEMAGTGYKHQTTDPHGKRSAAPSPFPRPLPAPTHRTAHRTHRTLVL